MSRSAPTGSAAAIRARTFGASSRSIGSRWRSRRCVRWTTRAPPRPPGATTSTWARLRPGLADALAGLDQAEPEGEWTARLHRQAAASEQPVESLERALAPGKSDEHVEVGAGERALRGIAERRLGHDALDQQQAARAHRGAALLQD